MKKIRFVNILIFSLLLYGCGDSKAKLQLPSSATEVKKYHSSSWNGDYVKLIKAKLPYKDFKVYAKSLGLSNYLKKENDIDFSIQGSLLSKVDGSPSWWNPPITPFVQEIYFTRSNRENWKSLIWYKGYIYYRDISI